MPDRRYRGYGELLAFLELLLVAGLVALSAWSGLTRSNLREAGTVIIIFWLSLASALLVAAVFAVVRPGRIGALHYVTTGLTAASSTVFAIIWRTRGDLSIINVEFMLLALFSTATLVVAVMATRKYRRRRPALRVVGAFHG
jgi:hypothetical protein